MKRFQGKKHPLGPVLFTIIITFFAIEIIIIVRCGDKDFKLFSLKRKLSGESHKRETSAALKELDKLHYLLSLAVL